MTILVTGGAGLVGARLLPRLVETGIRCRALVRAGRAVPSGVTAFAGDLLDPASLVEAVAGVEAIIHLAAVLRTPDAGQIWCANVDGTRNLIAAATKYAANARFILASTGLVYNEASPGPSLESDPVAPERDYPASKVAAERLLQDSGLNWSVLRFGFIYGDADGHIGQIPQIAHMLKLHPANRLSMLHHRDVATFAKMSLDGAWDGRIVNAADDAPMSIFDLSAIAGAPMQLDDAPLDHPWSGVLDGSLARSLGFRPEIPTTWQATREGVL